MEMRRDHIKASEVSQTVEKRGKPEIHLNTAITFVWGGDPYALNVDDRNQKEIEIKQYAAVLKYGQITPPPLHKVFSEFEYLVLQELRKTGALTAGS